MVKKVVNFVTEKFKILPLEARKRVDGDYSRGYVMYLTAAVVTVGEDGIESIQKKTQQRIIDRKDGDAYFIKDEVREMPELKEFEWDEAISHVNSMTSKAEAWANS